MINNDDRRHGQRVNEFHSVRELERKSGASKESEREKVAFPSLADCLLEFVPAVAQRR